MLDQLEPAPPDPILGLTEAFREDPRPDKINLGVGVYRDDRGRTPVLDAVKRAERRLVEVEETKTYLPIDGDPAYAALVQRLLLGADHPVVAEGRAATSHTPGGTGALRIAGELLRAMPRKPTLWLSTPTWENHGAVFTAAGLTTRAYPYFDPEASDLDFDGMVGALRAVAAGDVVLLHGCCHNPSGVDPSSDQWRTLAEVLAERGAVPLVDLAYQGLGDGLDADAEGLRTLAKVCPEVLVCSSFSKSFGLYRERVGALTVITASAHSTAAVQSNVRVCIRRTYSNPPAHGAAVVRAVLEDPELRRAWEGELGVMRERIQRMRQALAAGLDARGVRLRPSGNGFIVRQKGMFSFSGLDPAQVEALRERHGVYVVRSGRINVAGITDDRLDDLCDALAAVVGT